MTILWDVVEEHLDEAEFMIERWQAAVRSPRLSLARLRASVEERLVAHLDGLAEEGRAVADALLWPALEADAEAPAERVAAAALALLVNADPAARERLVGAFGAAETAPLRDGLQLALTLTPRDDVGEPVRLALHATGDPATQSACLAVLAARGVDAGPILGTLLGRRDPPLVGAALAAAAASDRARLRGVVEGLLAHDARAVRAAAVRTGLVWNLSSAWQACKAEARAGAPEALLPLALLGGPGELALVADALGAADRRQAALFALGFSGSVDAVTACLPALDDADPAVAGLAAEAIAGITGLPLYEKAFVLPPPDDDGDAPADDAAAAGLAPPAHEELPIPNPEGIRAWWSERRAAFPPPARYLRGAPLSVAAVEAALEEGSLRGHAPLAFEVGIRSAGHLRFPGLRIGYPKPALGAEVSLFRQPRWC